MDPMVATFIFHVTLTGLQEYNTYEIRVRTVNAEGNGPINCRGSFGEAPPHFYQTYRFDLGAPLKLGGYPNYFYFSSLFGGGPPNDKLDFQLGGPPLFYHQSCPNSGGTLHLYFP